MELPYTNSQTQLEEQLSIFLLSHISLRRFFSQLLQPSKCLLLGQLTTSRRIHLPIIKKDLINIFPTPLLSHLLLKYPYHGQLTAIPSTTNSLML